MTSLSSPSKPFVWSSCCLEAVEAAKALLCNMPVLASPDFLHPFKLNVDASGHGAGAALLQEDARSVDHPVCFFSKKFNRHQINHSTIEKEALALLLALQHFEVYAGSAAVPVVAQQQPAFNVLIFVIAGL